MTPPITFRALAVAFFGFYILPLMVFYFLRWVLGLFIGEDAVPVALDIGVGLLWVWVFAPLGAGYMAARLSRSLPLWHGALVAILGVLFHAMFFNSDLPWVWIGLIAWALSAGLFGAWVWRYRTTKAA
jgi:hypothetical protein